MNETAEGEVSPEGSSSSKGIGSSEDATPPTPRRGFLQSSSLGIMVAGIAAGYGSLAAIAGRFLYPSRRREENWQFVATLDSISAGESLIFETPDGAQVVVARQQEPDEAESFVALSSVCPHLGCAVHWETQNNRFFCPCHNGAFDPSGKATEGPPAAANQSLERFPLKVERGLLYIAVSSESINRRSES